MIFNPPGNKLNMSQALMVVLTTIFVKPALTIVCKVPMMYPNLTFIMHSATIKYFKTLELIHFKSKFPSQSKGEVNAPPCPTERNPAIHACACVCVYSCMHMCACMCTCVYNCYSNYLYLFIITVVICYSSYLAIYSYLHNCYISYLVILLYINLYTHTAMLTFS